MDGLHSNWRGSEKLEQIQTVVAPSSNLKKVNNSHQITIARRWLGRWIEGLKNASELIKVVWLALPSTGLK